MSTHFNSALRQSTAIRKDLDAFTEATNNGTPTTALQGQLSTSLTSFSRTLDDYAKAVLNELVPEKKQRDEDRLSNFRTELLDYRSRFASLKHEAEEARESQQRSELLGRRPHGATSTPENPYSDVASSSREGPGANPLFRVNNPNFQHSQGNAYSNYRSPYALDTGSSDTAREEHAYREQNFFGSTNATLDEYIERGRAVLGDLDTQRDALKATQRKLYSVGATLGISGESIKQIERRAKQDKWVFGIGCFVFIVFVYLVLHYLR